MRVRRCRCLDNLADGRLGPREANVLSNCSRKENGILEDDCELVTEIRQLVILQVHIVQCDYSIRSVEEAEKEIGKTSLT